MRFRDLLLEYDRAKTVQNLGRNLVKRFSGDHNSPQELTQTIYDALAILGGHSDFNNVSANQIAKIAEPILAYIESQDPSRNKQYVTWMTTRYIKGGIRYLEDMAKTGEALAAYDEIKRSGYFRRNQADARLADIGQFSGYGDLQTFVDRVRSADALTSNNQQKRDEYASKMQALVQSGQAEMVADTDRYRVVIPKTWEASKFFGMGTRWCTASEKTEDQFKQYTATAPLYCILPKNSPHKFQLHFGKGTGQYMNELDERITDADDFPTDVMSLFDDMQRLSFCLNLCISRARASKTIAPVLKTIDMSRVSQGALWEVILSYLPVEYKEKAAEHLDYENVDRRVIVDVLRAHGYTRARSRARSASDDFLESVVSRLLAARKLNELCGLVAYDDTAVIEEIVSRDLSGVRDDEQLCQRFLSLLGEWEMTPSQQGAIYDAIDLRRIDSMDAAQFLTGKHAPHEAAIDVINTRSANDLAPVLLAMLHEIGGAYDGAEYRYPPLLKPIWQRIEDTAVLPEPESFHGGGIVQSFKDNLGGFLVRLRELKIQFTMENSARRNLYQIPGLDDIATRRPLGAVASKYQYSVYQDDKRFAIALVNDAMEMAHVARYQPGSTDYFDAHARTSYKDPWIGAIAKSVTGQLPLR